MPEENEETQETQQTQQTLEAIKAELEEEKEAKATLEKLATENAARIAELTQLKDIHSKAVSKYLDAVKAANPTIPGDVITGDTIEDIDASVQKAQSIAESVKANLEAQAKEAKVPAGAPPRGEISLEGLTPREKIAAGIQQKGGTS